MTLHQCRSLDGMMENARVYVDGQMVLTKGKGKFTGERGPRGRRTWHVTSGASQWGLLARRIQAAIWRASRWDEAQGLVVE